MDFLLNMLDPDVRRDPYRYYKEMRELGPVLRNPLTGGWMVWRFDDVTSIITDHDTYSSEGMRARQAEAGFEDNFGSPTMLNSDPPDHERYRGVVARAFTPRAISALEPGLRELAGQLVAPVADGAPYDVVDRLSGPLPVLAIAQMLGVSGDDSASFRTWSDDLVSSGDLPTPEEAERSRDAAANLRAYFQREIDKRRAKANGRDDLVERLVEANEGNVLNDAELLASCVLLLVAGNETTTNLITNMTLQLARHPDQRKRLVEDPSLIPSAIEETLRFDGPVHWTVRTPTRDVEVASQPIAAGEMIFVLLAAANRDPAKFDDPDAYDVGRPPANHLGFGHGTHFCLGANLARLETRLAFESLLPVARDYELVDPEALPHYPRFNLRSPRHLEIHVRSGATTGAA